MPFTDWGAILHTSAGDRVADLMIETEDASLREWLDSIAVASSATIQTTTAFGDSRFQGLDRTRRSRGEPRAADPNDYDDCVFAWFPIDYAD